MGDEIIMDSVKTNLAEYLDSSYVVQLPVHTPLFHIYQALLKKSVKYYNEVDYKFICGTNLIYTNMLRPLPLMNVHLFNTRLWRDSVLLGVGSEKNSKRVSGYTKLLYSKILSKKFYHSVRDERTRAIVEGLGYKVLNTGCPTLWDLSPAHCSLVPENKSDSVVFTLTDHDPHADADKSMIKILRQSYQNLYFWPQSMQDLAYLQVLDESENVSIVPANVNAFRKLLQSDIDYVGTRLHGGIFALKHGRRAIIVAIDYRARGMKESVALPVIERQDVKTELGKMINSEYRLAINIDTEKIKLWKSQFGMI